LEKLKSTYLLWFSYYQTLPKTHRYSLGKRIDDCLVASIESIATASFLPKKEKLSFVKIAIRKTDTVKILLLILWESHSLDTKKYALLSEKLEEIGKMLGGWNGQLVKQNSSAKAEEK
jgi:four helix bundle protein